MRILHAVEHHDEGKLAATLRQQIVQISIGLGGDAGHHALMRAGAGQSVEGGARLKTHGDAGRAASINDALQFDIAALAGHSDMRDAARPRSQRLFDGVDTVKHVHVLRV